MNKTQPFVFILFGATGDLASRKIFPALYNLYQSQIISQKIIIIGNSRQPRSDEDFRRFVLQSLNKYYGAVDLPVWHHLEKRLFFIHGDAKDQLTVKNIFQKLNNLSKTGFSVQNRLFHVGIIPEVYPVVLKNLGQSINAYPTSGWQKVMIEKPFGIDLNSAKTLNRLIARYFKADDIFRMDHFLAKETVQNIIAFRFANGLFEPIWNKDFIDNIQITAFETQGVDGREIFYDHTGALRDVVQNHVLQILAITLMDIPSSLNYQSVRQKTFKILNCLDKISAKDISSHVVYGQYGRGIICNKIVRAYIQEENIKENSRTETYVALKIGLKCKRWQGVPIYIRAGKRMSQNVTEVSIQFKDPVKNMLLFSKQMSKTILTIRIQPNEGIILRFDAKKPGFDYQLQPSTMEFRYQSAFVNTPIIEAYQRLIADAVKGDHILFPNADSVEAAWKFITPLIPNHVKPFDFEIYSGGSSGPFSADKLLENDGRFWFKLSSDIK